MKERLHCIKQACFAGLFLLLLATGPVWAATKLQDEGSDVGYVNILNVVGPNVEATRSGIVGTITESGAGGSGDNITVNSSPADTTANLKDNSAIAFTLTDGGAGGPDDITADIVNDSIDGTELADTLTLDAALAIEGQNLTYNDLGADVDFRVEGDTDTNLIRTDAGNDRVGIGVSAPVAKLDVNGDVVMKGPIVDVRAYGVIGDAATDNTAAFQAAIDAFPNGAIFQFPAGDFNFDDSVYFDSANGAASFIVRGVGFDTVIMPQSFTTKWLFFNNQDSLGAQGVAAPTKPRLTFEHMLVDGEDSTSARFCYFDEASTVLRHMRIEQMQYGLGGENYTDHVRIDYVSWMSPVSGGWLYESPAAGDIFYGNQIFTYPTESDSVKLNRCYGASIVGANGGRYYFTQSSAITMLNCHLETTQRPDVGSAQDAVLIENSLVTVKDSFLYAGSGTDYSIHINDTGGTHIEDSQVIVEGNEFYHPIEASTDAHNTDIYVENYSEESTLILKNNVGIYKKVGSSAPGYKTGIFCGSGTAGIATAFTNALPILSGQVILRDTNGSWEVVPLAPLDNLRSEASISQPTVAATEGTDFPGSLADATTYYYKVAIYTMDGNSIGSTEASDLTTAANHSIQLAVDCQYGPSVIRVWRGTSTETYDRFVDIPVVESNCTLYDTGTHVAGIVWITVGVPSVPSSDDSNLGLVVPGGYELVDTGSSVISLHGLGGSNNEDLTIDLEGTADRVVLGSTTGAAYLNFGTFSANFADNERLEFGAGGDAVFIFDEAAAANDSYQLGLRVGSADQSGYFSIMEKADLENANRRPAGTTANPTLRIYSADETVATDYIDIYHNQTNGVIDVGTGVISMADDVTLAANKTLTVTDSATDSPVNVTERSVAPSSPAANDIYVDDGTNTASGNPGFRRYTGAGWEDMGATAGGSGAPTDATYITQTANGSLSAEQALGSLATGIVKNTTTTGVLSIAAEGTDYYGPAGTDVALADGGTGQSLVDPGADGIMLWDDSDTGTEWDFAAIGTGLSYDGTTLTAPHTATAITDDLIINADLNIDVEAVDGDFLQYDSTGDNFTWRSGAETLSDIGAQATVTDGDALTFTGATLDFDGGASPGGELGGTWASPTIDDTGITLTSITIGALLGVDSIDATGAVDMDYGSADVTDHTFISDGGTTVIDGSVNIPASTSYQVASTAILSDSAGTMTLSNVDAADATTENTVEALIFDADAESISGTWEVQDDVDFVFGNDANWAVQYDEGVDDQLLIATTGTAATATTDPLLEILVGTTPTADQQVFGVAKGTQATNTPLLTLDEDGDFVVAATITAGSGSGAAGQIDLGDAGGFTGLLFDATSTTLEVWIDGSQVGHFATDGSYTDDVP